MISAFRRLSLRHFAEHRLRTALTALGIALGVAAIIGIRLVNDSAPRAAAALAVAQGLLGVALSGPAGAQPAPAFAAPLTNPFGLADVGFDSSPALADIDDDGDLDAFLGAFTGNTLFFANTGTASAPAFAAPLANPFGLADVGFASSPALADIDGDGDLDAFVGEGSGNTLLFENVATSGNCVGKGNKLIKAKVKAKVKDALGTPIADVKVKLLGPDCKHRALTNAVGVALFPNLAKGSYTVKPKSAACTFDPPRRLSTFTAGQFKAKFIATCP